LHIRWGILGAGDVAERRVADAIRGHSDSQLVAACRRNPKKLKEFCDRFDVPRAHTSDTALIADDQIDAVYVATPVSFHRPQTIAAAQVGKHVLCEKPMAMSVSECDEMIDACHHHQVRLGVAYYRRFYPVVSRIKQLIGDGEIGEVLTVSVSCATHFSMTPQDQGYWRVQPELGGGGSLMDIGSHRINLLLDMFGKVQDVQSFCDTTAVDYESENCASLLLRFKSGVHCNLQAVFGTPVDPDEIAIMGTRGRIVTSPLNGGGLTIQSGSNQRIEQHPPPDNFNLPLIANFVEAIKEQRPPIVSGEEGRETNIVMQRAYEQSRSK